MHRHFQTGHFRQFPISQLARATYYNAASHHGPTKNSIWNNRFACAPIHLALGGAYDFCMEAQCDYFEQTNPFKAIEYIKLCFMAPMLVLLADTKIAGGFHKNHMAIFQTNNFSIVQVPVLLVSFSFYGVRGMSLLTVNNKLCSDYVSSVKSTASYFEI